MQSVASNSDQPIPGNLIFVRHGETEWNQLSRYQGTTDTDLSQHGIKQAKENAMLIKEMIDHKILTINQIVSSPLMRARKTSKTIAETLVETTFSTENNILPITENNALRELSLGRWEGLNSQQVKDQFYEERRSRKDNRWEFAPIGGESMQSRSNALTKTLQTLQSGTIVVTHAGILRIILHLLGGYDKETAAAFAVPHTGIFYWNSAKLHTMQNFSDLALTPGDNCAKVTE